MKHLLNFLFVWVLFSTCNDAKFIEKINSLPKETVENSKIQFSTAYRSHYIMYWE